MADQNPKMRRFPRGCRPVARPPFGSTFSIKSIIYLVSHYSRHSVNTKCNAISEETITAI
nr:MAG TPA: hypothetical protein [Bacteriophage sp.]